MAELPPAVADSLRSTFPGAELLHVWKEIEDGNECYVVRIRENGRVIDLYGSPAGHLFVRQEEGFGVSDVPSLLEGSLIVLLLGSVAGAIAKWMVQVGRGERLPVLAEWLAAWVGAVIGIGLLLSQIATVPREKDWLVIGLLCSVWGAVSASIVEMLCLVVPSVRGYRASCRRWILVLCVAAIAFLSLTIPVDMLRKHRENEHYRALALRLSTG